jgi:signal transduction histidine kinase/catechol 2,3-dioxygenase-like lactoylglutathione lyase family enzyme
MISSKSIHTKLAIAFLALMVIPLTATGLYGHFFTRTALSQQALDRSIHQVHLQAESIVSALQQVQGDALHLGSLRNFERFQQQTVAEEREFWRRELEQDFLELASVRPMYHGLRLVDTAGQGILEIQQADAERLVASLPDAINTQDQPWITEVLRQPLYGVWVGPFLIGNIPYIHYAFHLPDGVLVIDLSASWLLRSLPIRPGSDTWAMVDQDGGFIVYPDGFEPTSSTPYIPLMLENGSGSLETANSVYVYDTIYPSAQTEGDNAPRQAWVIFRQTPTEVLYASVNDFYRVALLFLIGAAVFAVGLAWFTSSLLVNPIKQLERLAAQFGHTGVAPELPAKLANDEIGSLTRTFFEMAHELEGKRKLEHRLIERLINAQEEERKLVAYDLHDGLIQQLVGARLHLSKCQRVCTQQTADTQLSIRHGCDALSEAIVEGRRIIEGLRPATLDDLGLATAIEEVARTTADACGWSLELDIQTLPHEPEKTVAVTLYRIAQEALNNARKHAKAKRVKVALHNGDGIHLLIEDDGVGFDRRKLGHDGEGHGLGITTMQERASLISGDCTINTEADKGTRIEVYVPHNLTVLAEPDLLIRPTEIPTL